MVSKYALVMVIVMAMAYARGEMLRFPTDGTIYVQAEGSLYMLGRSEYLTEERRSDGSLRFVTCAESAESEESRKLVTLTTVAVRAPGQPLCQVSYDYPPYFERCNNRGVTCKQLFEEGNLTGYPIDDDGLSCVTGDFTVVSASDPQVWLYEYDGPSYCDAGQMEYRLISGQEAGGTVYWPTSYAYSYEYTAPYVGCTTGAYSETYSMQQFGTPLTLASDLQIFCGVQDELPAPPTTTDALIFASTNEMRVFSPSGGNTKRFMRVSDDINAFTLVALQRNAGKPSGELFYFGPNYCCDYSVPSRNQYGIIDTYSEVVTEYWLPPEFFTYIDATGSSHGGRAYALYADYDESSFIMELAGPTASGSNYTSMANVSTTVTCDDLYVSDAQNTLYLRCPYEASFIAYNLATWENYTISFDSGDQTPMHATIDDYTNSLYGVYSLNYGAEWRVAALSMEGTEWSPLPMDGFLLCSGCGVRSCTAQVSEGSPAILACSLDSYELLLFDLSTGSSLTSSLVGFADSIAFLFSQESPHLTSPAPL